MDTIPRLSIRSLSKTFGPVRVLTDVALTVLPGEIHGLAGQNGSGKSTLIKVLTGLHTPGHAAEYQVDGRSIPIPVHWEQVRSAGISVVHQDLGLLDQLSVAENICVGGFPRSGLSRRIDRRSCDRIADRTLGRLGVELDPGRLVASLTAAERAEVAIARALRDHAAGAGLIILDESTRALTGDDLVRVHEMLRRITREGSAAIMISHNLTELMTVTDRLTILRDGRLAGEGLLTSSLTEEEIARRMLGGTLGESQARRSSPVLATDARVTVTGLRGRRLSAVDFAVRPGEVLGITGVSASGYEEIPYLVAGAQRAAAGVLETGGHRLDLATAGVSKCLRAGIVLVPERRERDGLAFEMTIRDNINLPRLSAQGRPWFLARGWQRTCAAEAISTLDIRPRQDNMLVKQLSGGNQQKVLLGKWLGTGPAVLVLHEPTQAVDVGARQDILHALRRAADSDVAVLLVSSEAEDLAAICDRILVYRPDRGLIEADASGADALLAYVYETDAVTSGATP